MDQGINIWNYVDSGPGFVSLSIIWLIGFELFHSLSFRLKGNPIAAPGELSAVLKCYNNRSGRRLLQELSTPGSFCLATTQNPVGEKELTC